MNLVKTLKSAAVISAIALSIASPSSFAAVVVPADAPLGVKTCTRNCDLPDPNGPSLDGFDGAISKAPSLRQCPSKGNCEIPDQNGPSLDGFALPVPAGVIQNGHYDLNGPSLDGFVAPTQLKTCPSKGNCDLPDQNGPSLDGFVAPAGAKPGVCYNDRNGLGLDGFAAPAGVIQNGCHDLNGPSLNGFSDLPLGTVIIAIDKP